jgi:hypothetical protein
MSGAFDVTCPRYNLVYRLVLFMVWSAPDQVANVLGVHPAKAGVGAGRVVVGAPRFDDQSCFAEAVEQVLILAFVPEPAVEALDKGVLHRLARRDVVPFDAGPL